MLVAGIVGLLGSYAVVAADLSIGIAARPASLDPHRAFQSTDILSRHLFDRLIHLDHHDRLRPGLAVAVSLVDERTWELRLRPNVVFHDGSRFTSADVITSLARVVDLSDPRTGLASRWGARRIEPVGELAVRIYSEQPDPFVLLDSADVAIISAGHAGAGKQAFDRVAPNGTGPYRLAETRPDGAYVLERNEIYWGTKPEWLTVVLQPIEGATPRVEALLKGEVQFIEQVPTLALAPFEQSPRVVVSRALSDQLIYLQLDQRRDHSPYVSAIDGATLEVNPLKDVQVRLALTKAIDRRKIVAQVLHDVGLVATQLMPEGRFGTSTEVVPIEHDPEESVELLTQAGWENGFELVLHAPNGHYANDAQVMQSIAAMFREVGVEARVEMLAPDIYFKRASRGGPGGTPEFSAMLLGWRAFGGDTSSVLRHVVHSHDRGNGLGLANRGGYENQEVDRYIEQALLIQDEQSRANLLARATEIALSEVAIIPLHFQEHAWAAREGLGHRPRADGATLAMDIYSE